MIIGITGTIGAGKGAVVEYLIKKKGFAHYSCSGLLKEILEERGEIVDRDGYSRIAKELRAKDSSGVPGLAYARAQNEGARDSIIEALHSVGEAEFIKSVGGIVFGVDANIDVRYRRISTRGSEKDNVSYEKFIEQSKREDEGGSDASGHNIRGAIKIADYVITNNGTLEELHAQIEEVLRKIEATPLS